MHLILRTLCVFNLDIFNNTLKFGTFLNTYIYFIYTYKHIHIYIYIYLNIYICLNIYIFNIYI